MDTITLDQYIKDGETVVSAGKVFELGFFSPGKSRSRYLGIWYKKDDENSVAWVVNRNTPISDSSGFLRINAHGSLVLRMKSTNDTVWSSNASTSLRNPVALLLESGNLVVKDEKDNNPDNFLWQSFDYPCDSLSPGMKLGKNLVTGMEWILSSRKSIDDPAPGDFTFQVDPHGFPQLFLKKGPEIMYRAGSWNGLRWTGTPRLKPNSVYIYDFVSNEKEVFYTFDIRNRSVPSRVAVTPSGHVQRYTWIDRTRSWERVSIAAFDDGCNNYALCGSYASCNINNYPDVCKCLEGFTPKSPREWKIFDWNEGFVRRAPLPCNHSDGFLKHEALKLPDTSQSWAVKNISLVECEKLCLNNCSCTAYANLDVREGGTGCLLWFSDLFDIKTLELNGQDLYVRVAASESGEVDEPKPTRNREGFKRGGRVERGPLMVEHWLHDEVFEGEMDDGFEEDARLDRRPRDRRPIYGQRREPWRGAAEYEGDRRREKHHSRGPRKPKVDFPHFNGGDPHEWLDKVEHYFQGPSPVVNHHGQLAKLKQEGKVQAYIEEFRRLQILVMGWSKESLLGTFIEGLKPWLARELKLKRPQRLTEAMRMAEILEDSYYSDKKPFKESSGSKNFKSESNKDSWKGKGAIEDSSKKESKDVKKLTKEEVFMIIDSSESDDVVVSDGEATSDEGELRVAELGENNCDAELSLNAMSGVSKPSTMRLMAWVGKFEVSMLIDSGSSRNFINTNIIRKIGLRGAAIEPFDVKVANGEKLKLGVDVVLGNAWLKSIGKVVTDFDAMTMKFKLGGRKRTWAVLPFKEIKQCEAQMIERLCKGGAQCFAVVNELQDELQRLPEKIRKPEKPGFFTERNLTEPESSSSKRQSSSTNETTISFPSGFFSPGNSTRRYLGIQYKVVFAKTVAWVANRETSPTDHSGVLNVTQQGILVLIDGMNRRIWSSNTSRTSSALRVRKSYSITPSQSIKDGETLDSAGGTFELAFFSLGNSTRRYLGIRYKVVLDKTVAWVANRETSLTDQSGVLNVTQQGTLVLLDVMNRIIWSSNTSRTVKNPVVQLLKSGNLVVKDENDDDSRNFLWQSFDHPTDTFLPGMKLGRNFVTGLDTYLSSWKSSEDPAPGQFSLWIDPHGFPQLVLRNGSALRYRAGSWNGIRFTGTPRLNPNPEFLYRFELNKDETDSSSSVCVCLNGFKPKSPEEWRMSNWSKGCVRMTELNCEKRDEFWNYTGLKLPDTSNSTFNTSMSLQECKEKCLKDCSCTAYANSNISQEGSGCLLWFGNLTDMIQYDQVGQNFYIRMAIEKDDGNATLKKRVGIIVGSVIFIAILLVGLIFYIRRRKLKKQGNFITQSSICEGLVILVG
ncbi:hypothetical protein EZV62_008513 [Acer yangbiense]|uniref:Bulb-type lectin domain-containing protein n=1 Tax=Acer yangbiense TaxID=1000413 RepID=A0A5C7IDW4_9ROSI|nr:hypothetical protein EZV62_008513 [Acer yangbiense]